MWNVDFRLPFRRLLCVADCECDFFFLIASFFFRSNLTFYWTETRGAPERSAESEIGTIDGILRHSAVSSWLINLHLNFLYFSQDSLVHRISVVSLNYAHDLGIVCRNRYGNGHRHIQVYWILRVSWAHKSNISLGIVPARCHIAIKKVWRISYE